MIIESKQVWNCFEIRFAYHSVVILINPFSFRSSPQEFSIRHFLIVPGVFASHPLVVPPFGIASSS